jgi:hypothetical protein
MALVARDVKDIIAFKLDTLAIRQNLEREANCKYMEMTRLGI